MSEKLTAEERMNILAYARRIRCDAGGGTLMKLARALIEATEERDEARARVAELEAERDTERSVREQWRDNWVEAEKIKDDLKEDFYKACDDIKQFRARVVKLTRELTEARARVAELEGERDA